LEDDGTGADMQPSGRADRRDAPTLLDGGVQAPAGGTSNHSANLRAIMRIPVTIKVVVGCATLPIAELTALERGSLVPLDRQAGDKVDVVANGRVIARGQVVVIDGEASRFAVSIDEIVGH
jgi:flagellar motor switch protein FliN